MNPPPGHISEASKEILPSTHSKNNRPTVAIFRVLAGILGGVILMGWTLGGLTIYAGRCIAKRKNRNFVMVMAGINCIWIPYGTLLGACSFILLSSERIEHEYPRKTS